MWWFGAAEKAADNLLDKDTGLLTQVGNWIGNMELTDEERLETNGKTVASVQQFVKDTLSESTVRSKTRRLIAKLWVFMELALIGLSAVCVPIDHYAVGESDLSKQFFALASSEIMFYGTVAIIVFYFGSYGVERVVSKKTDS